MAVNDISVRPSKEQVSIQGSHTTYYGADVPDSTHHRIRRTRTQDHALRAPLSSTVVWPCDYIEVDPPAPAQTVTAHSSIIQFDPDHFSPEDVRVEFRHVLQENDPVFDSSITGYNGTAGFFEATVDMSPAKPLNFKHV